MFENLKNINDGLRSVKELRKLMEKPEYQTPEKLMEALGFDMTQFEEEFERMQAPSPVVDLEYIYKSENKEPSYAYPSDSGFDLRANEVVHFLPFERKLVPTGLFVNIPEGYEIQVRPKSGLAINKGLSVLNTPGTVDQGYTGEIKVIVINMSNLAQTIELGDKIAQAVLTPVMQGKWVNLKRVLNFEDGERSDNGFGSTGN